MQITEVDEFRKALRAMSGLFLAILIESGILNADGTCNYKTTEEVVVFEKSAIIAGSLYLTEKREVADRESELLPEGYRWIIRAIPRSKSFGEDLFAAYIEVTRAQIRTSVDTQVSDPE